MSSSLSEDDDLSALLILLPRGIESSEEVDPSADLAFALLKRGFFYIGKLTEKKSFGPTYWMVFLGLTPQILPLLGVSSLISKEYNICYLILTEYPYLYCAMSCM